MSEAATRSHSATIARKLLRCLIISILLPMVLLTVSHCVKLAIDYRQSAQRQMSVSLNLIGDYVQSYFQDFNIITTAPYYHSYFSSYDSLEPGSAGYLAYRNEIQSEMRSLLDLTTLSRSDIVDLFLWSDGQFLYYSFYNELTYFSQLVERQPWYQHAAEGGGAMVVTPVSRSGEGELDTSSFYITRRIYNFRQPEQNSLIFLNVLTDSFDSYCRELDLLYDAFLVVTNERGELIYSSRGLTQEAVDHVRSGSSFQYDRSSWTTLSKSLDSPALQIHLVFSLDDVGRQLLMQIAGVLAIYLVGLAVVLYLYRRLNLWIGRSTRALLDTCTQLEEGNLKARCPAVEVVEFNRIGGSINHMTARLNEKIQNEYLMTIRQKTIQLYSLQSQIQPHFLINTIYCFMALNQVGERDKLNSGFFSLANLLRYVLSQDFFTTLEQELTFLEHYLKLQQLRFGERLSYEIRCPEELRSFRIPRLLLQPLIENAVIHGIEPCEHPCFCRISVSSEGEALRICIEDNGVGFDPEELARKSAQAAQRAFQPEEEAAALARGERKKTSIGLYYVKERLHMWNPQAKLSIRCGQVTQAELWIPRKEEEPSEPAHRG